MAVNVTVLDLENFPNNSKTVTVDLSELVPFGNSGEDSWVFSTVTTATASGGAAIQKLYINDTKWGWIKSSGLKPGPYTINDSQKHLKVAVDEAIGSGAEITLATSALPIAGSAVAKDIQAKINNLASAGGSKAGNLSYLNTTVRFTNGTFEIISGTASDEYTGSSRSSVAIADGTSTTGLASELGFDITFSSENLASTLIKQTSVASVYSAESTSLTIADSGRVVGGDCIAITDGTNLEFRGVESGIGASVTLSSGFTNGYAAGALIQVLDIQDPSGDPPPAFNTIDDYVKFGINSIANQINFAS